MPWRSACARSRSRSAASRRSTSSRSRCSSSATTCCAAALEKLRIIEEERLLERSRKLEVALAGALAPLREHSLVGEVRAGPGFLAAVELDAPVLAARPDAVVRLQRLAREEGVLLRPLPSSVAMSPPLVCEPAEVEVIGRSIATALWRLEEEL